MWTTSSLRASANRLTAGVLAAAGFLHAAPAQEKPPAPDAPLPARAETPRAVVPPRVRRSVELTSVQVRLLEKTRDPAITRLAEPVLEKSKDAVMIEVKLEKPLDPKPRDSWPVIVLNGTRLKNTWPAPGAKDKLIAFVADRKLLKDKNTVSVMWVGDEKRTATKKPLTFEGKDVPK